MTSRLALLLATVLLAVGCSLSPAGTSPRPTDRPEPTQSSQPSATSQAQHSASPGPIQTDGPWFYLRGYYSQAIPPQYTFSWLPPVTITELEYINGNVAVPAIYPRPLMVMPVSSAITRAGIQIISDRARELGLLSGSGDFTGGLAMPGARLVNIDLIIDGGSHHLVGPEQTPPCDPAMCLPGTPQAFGTFWNQLLTLDNWIPTELGHSEQYAPERVALMLTQVDDPPTMSPRPTLVQWPLDTPLTAGCTTLAGSDLETMLPTLEAATQLTAFIDGNDVGTAVYQPTARVLVPGEPEICPSAS